MNICVFFPNFNHNDYVGVFHFYFQVVELGEEHRSHFPAYLRGLHREAFVAALRLHLEGFYERQHVGKIVLRLFGDVLPVFFGDAGAGQRHNAEHLLQPCHRLVQVDFLALRLDVYGGLRLAEFELAQIFKPAPAIFHKSVLEPGAVQPFQGDFTAFYKYYLFHELPLFI